RGLFTEQAELVASRLRLDDTDSALACYDRACGFQTLIPDDPEALRALEELHRRMLPVRYRTLTDRGRYLSMTFRYEEAYQVFTQLKAIGETIGMPLDESLDSLYRKAYKHHMLNEISMATGMIWNDQLDQAQTYVQKIESVMDVYNMELDPDLQAALNGYRQKIEHRICQNLLDEVQLLSIRAQRNLELLQFDIAVTQLAEARLTARKKPDCEIVTASLADTINRYISAAFYQEKLKQVRQLIAIGQYKDAIQIAFDNENFYRNTNLEALKVPFVSAETLILSASLVPFTAEAVTYGIRSGNLDASWKYLTWLKMQEAYAKSVREQQEMVGQALAARDFSSNPTGNMIENVKRYTGGNRWFAIFEEAYYSKWKQLFNETFIH
ncbi:MAG: hypothetical protein V1733_07095, partial [bacterium]